MYKLDSEKAEEPEIKLLTFVGLWRKKENFRKKNKIYFYFIDYIKDFVSITKKLENSSRDGNTRPPDLPPEKPVCKTRNSS